MSAFAVFATVLTIGYIIYYGFTISRDIIASKKAEKSEVETFEVEAADQPQPTAVCETGDGFSIAPKQVEEQPPIEDASNIETVSVDNAIPQNNEAPAESKAEELVEKTKEEMEPMAEASEPGFSPDEMAAMIHNAISNASKETDSPRILYDVIDATHGQEVIDSPDDNPDENAEENAEPNDSQEEIRL